MPQSGTQLLALGTLLSEVVLVNITVTYDQLSIVINGYSQRSNGSFPTLDAIDYDKLINTHSIYLTIADMFVLCYVP